jgi:hypothetical protein
MHVVFNGPVGRNVPGFEIRAGLTVVIESAKPHEDVQDEIGP